MTHKSSLPISRSYRPVHEIFQGSLLKYRASWQIAIQARQRKTCLMATDSRSQKFNQMLQQIAANYRRRGWELLLWTPLEGVKRLQTLR